MEEIKPQGIPEEILKQEGSMDLYRWGIWFVGGILAGIIIGVIVLSAMNMQVPDMLGNVAILLAGALVSLIGGERIANNG